MQISSISNSGRTQTLAGQLDENNTFVAIKDMIALSL